MAGTNQEIEGTNSSVATPSVYNSYNIDSSVTGSTTETVLVNLKVTGGDMDINGILRVESELAKIGTAGVFTTKSYVSTVGTNLIGNTGVPSSSTLTGTYTPPASVLCLPLFSRRIVNKGNASLNYVYNSAQNTANVYQAASNSARILLNINTNNDFWIVITGTLANAADTGIVQNTQIYINKP